VHLAIEGEYRIAARREAVWAALNDVEVLRACIPGCEELVQRTATEIDGRIQAQLGPVKAGFATRITLSDIRPPEGYTLSGEGKAGVGFGRGAAKVDLIDDAGATILKYSATMQLGGKLAQVGSRLVEGATRQLADQFFDAFAKRLDAGATRAEAEAPPAAADAAGTGGGLSRWWWIAAATGILAAVVWALSR
jgi:carbon monoxide dehydrogenase subunit G